MALKLQLDETLVNAMIDAGAAGFDLGNLKARCVGVSRSFPTALADVSGIVGLAGRTNGSILVNMCQKVALKLASGMLMEDFTTFNEDVLDSIGELANVIGGRLKSQLANSGYPIDNITLPSVIVGQDYFVSHSKGLLVYHVTFQVDDPELLVLADRTVHVAMSVMAKDLKPSR
ncbi:CheY-P phosphatase CheX [Planctomycetes bacterium Pan216]|uniref:CheY-P phosphatase CheX n=1 Tax=Kolteria novifilia TaxID=2527975 RepID=A0A518B038_9BACT|nr:CheY-P phosphatase CheX [Planctomycetes bacterium Pan216]